MGFKMKYPITKCYLPAGTKRRSGLRMANTSFIVAHDTGNPTSTAKNNTDYFYRSANDMSASAHIFVDDKEIRECIPLLTGAPEKAWHVYYDVPGDNQKYGDDANDIAAGVELCYGSNINSKEAYKRYIWTMAYICYKFGFRPEGTIISHKILDPANRNDPDDALSTMGITYAQLLRDVTREFYNCIDETPVPKSNETWGTISRCIALNVRKVPRAVSDEDIIGQLKPGERIRIDRKAGDNGEWYSVYYGDHGGFIHGYFVDIDEPKPTPNPLVKDVQDLLLKHNIKDDCGHSVVANGLVDSKTKEALNKLCKKIL